MSDIFIKTIEIDDENDLINLIEGKNDNLDLRKDFIFRGISTVNYQLIPSSLRYDDCINDFIMSDFKLNGAFSPIEAKKLDESLDGEYSLTQINLDKHLNFIGADSNADSITSLGEVYYKKEVNVLSKFLNYADKSGLNVPFNQRIRESIDLDSDYGAKREFHIWPNSDYFEIISLAQHYGLPTRALDWSYDYKVALYFAVKSILSDKHINDNCVLWAFNYKKFDILNKSPNEPRNSFPLWCYRPQYFNNLNLSSQKGLFTFWCNSFKEDVDLRGFDEIIIDKLKKCKFKSDCNDKRIFKLSNFAKFSLKKDEKIFYKFVINSNLKPKILDMLYSEGYSEEYLFPGYSGVVESIKNRVKLDEILNK